MRSAKNVAQPVAVYDVSSSSVGGSHMLINKHNDVKAVVLAQVRNDALLQEDINMDRFVGDTIHNFEDVVQRVQKADIHKPDYIQLVLASPWYVSQTRTIQYKKEAPFTCTQKLVDSLVQKEVQYVLEHDMDRFGMFGKEGMIVEKQLSLIKLNGYNTSSPFGKKAEMLELYVTITVAPKVVVDRFLDTLRRAYGTKHIGITTSPYTSFVVARDLMKAKHECVVIDVGEEVTDVAFIKDNLFLYQHSFPVGTYEIYRAVSEHGNHTVLEAKTLIEAYRLGKVTGINKEAVEKAITAFRNAWQSGLQKILDDGHYGFCLPDQCYIVSDPRFELIFNDIISTDPFIQHTCSRGVVHPIPINAAMLAPYVKTIDGTDPDIPLGTAALFVERLLYYN
jgi:Tfp pilus assembly PilM family ATPase